MEALGFGRLGGLLDAPQRRIELGTVPRDDDNVGTFTGKDSGRGEASAFGASGQEDGLGEAAGSVCRLHPFGARTYPALNGHVIAAEQAHIAGDWEESDCGK